jgi:hypothetical protein
MWQLLAEQTVTLTGTALQGVVTAAVLAGYKALTLFKRPPAADGGEPRRCREARGDLKRHGERIAGLEAAQESTLRFLERSHDELREGMKEIGHRLDALLGRARPK